MRRRTRDFLRRVFYKCKNKQGFTLIEMVIATALVAIFFTMAASVLPAWFQSYKTIVNLSYARQIANNIVATVENQIMFAEGVNLLNGTDHKAIVGKKGNTAIQIPQRNADETIAKIEGLVYDDTFFRGMQVDMKFSVEKGKYCKVIITINDSDGSRILEKTRSIKLAGKSA